MDMTEVQPHVHVGMNMTLLHIELVVGTAVVITVILNLIFWIFRRRYNTRIANTISSNLKLSTSLEDEKAKSNIIINTIEDGVVLIDSKLTILLFNPGAAAITGWSIKEALGLTTNNIFKFIDEKAIPYSEQANPLSAVFKATETIRDHKITLVSRSERNIALDLSVTPLRGKDGEITAAVAVFRDVSAERSEEHQRAEFISTASHEMRTPVAAIEGYLALAMNEKVSKIDPQARGYIQKAHASTQHLGELFQDLLTSARAEDGRLTNNPVVIEASEFIKHLGEDLKFAADKKGLQVKISIGAPKTGKVGSVAKVIEPLYYVKADPERLREIISNLFVNAVKYTKQGTITLGVTGNDDVVQLRVADTGVGIPAEDVPHLFQKFYRVDSSATRTIGGTGLGLFIARKLVDLYNGRIWVDSREGEGSTFYINLPRVSQQKASILTQPTASTSAVPKVAAATPPTRRNIPISTPVSTMPTSLAS